MRAEFTTRQSGPAFAMTTLFRDLAINVLLAVALAAGFIAFIHLVQG